MTLKDIFKRRAGDAVIQAPPVADNYSLGLPFGGGYYGQSGALGLSAVYRCVDIIADSVAMLPPEVTRTSDGKYLSDSYLYDVFHNADDIMAYSAIVRQAVRDMLLNGNGYIYIYRGTDGRATRLRYMHHSDVGIVYNDATGDLYYSIPKVTPKKVEPKNVIHLRHNTTDGVHGISVLSAASGAIKTGKATERAAQSFFDAGCNLAGVLKVNSQLTPQQKNDIRKGWADAYGAAGSGIAVLQGNMEYQPIQINASDSQMIESRRYTVEDIARFFGVPMALLGEGNSVYGSLEAEMTAFLVHTLAPYIQILEEELNRKLLLSTEAAGIRIRLNEDAIIRTDMPAKATYLQTLVTNGIISRNEAREVLGYQAVEGGDDLVIAYTKISDNKVNNDDDKEGSKE